MPKKLKKPKFYNLAFWANTKPASPVMTTHATTPYRLHPRSS